MIIDYIRLDNFLSHNDSEIAFENGVNVIYGKNGAGKSSVIDGIRFALFGEKRGNSIAELIRSGARECSVTIGFRLNEKYYEVFRSQKLGKSGNISDRKSWIKVDGMIVAETAEGVVKEIQSGLRIDKDIFLNSVFVRQGEMDALISEMQWKREELFGRIIGINVLNDDAKAIKAIMDEVKIEGAQFSGLDEKIDENGRIIEAHRKEADTLEKDLLSLREKENASSAALSEADRKKNEAIKKKSDYDNLSRRISELSASKRKVEDKIIQDENRLRTISFSPEEKESIEKDPLFSNRDEIADIFRIKNDLKSLVLNSGNIENKIKEYEEDSAKLSLLQNDHKRYEESAKKVSEMEAEIREKERFKALKSSNTEDLSKEKGDLSKFEEIISAQAFQQFRDMDRRKFSFIVADLEKELRKIEGDRRELKARVGNINGLRDELRKNRETLGQNNRCPVCGTNLDSDHLKEIHDQYRAKDGEYVAQIEAIKVRLAELGNSYSAAEEKVARLRGKEIDEFLRAKEEAARLKESIAKKEDRLESLGAALEGLEALEQSFADLKNVLDALQENEKTYNSLIYSMNRVSIDELREQSTKLQLQIAEKVDAVKGLQAKIGFEPKDEDQARMQALMKKYDLVRNKESEYYRTKNEVDSSKGILKEIDAELSEKGRLALEMGNIAGMLSKAAEDYNKAYSEHSGIRADIATLEERISNIRSSISKLEDERNKLEADLERQSKIKEALVKLEKLRSAFGRDGIQSLIRKDSSKSINNMARNYLSSFNFEFDDIRIDENFNIKVINNGAEEPLDSLSGGERISLAIAVRLAIAKYLTGRVSTVIMDEPTNFLDEDRRNSLKDIIRYSLADEGMVQQMIMVTHHSELTSAADSSFEIVKINGVSTVTQG